MQNNEKNQPTQGGSFITYLEGADGQGQYLGWMFHQDLRKICGCFEPVKGELSILICPCGKGKREREREREREIYIYIYSIYIHKMMQIMNLSDLRANYPD